VLITAAAGVRRHPAWAFAALAVVVGFVIFQGSVLSSDSSAELKLAVAFSHGHLGVAWHQSRYPLEASLILLPAGIANVIGGHVAMGFVASLEYLLFGGALVLVGIHWTAALRPTESLIDRGQIIILATATTLLWVYIAKEPMDVVIAALLVACAVAARQADRVGWSGIALGLLLCSRDQMIPVALVGAAVLVIPLLLERRWIPAVRGAFPMLLAIGALALTNQARYGGITHVGPGYAGVVTYGTSLQTIVDSLLSPQAGLLFFAPLCLVGIATTWPGWRRPGRPSSALLAVGLALAIIVSVLFIHPSSSYLDIWSWGRSCRYFVPMVPITAFLIPRHPVGTLRPIIWIAGLVGGLWSAAMLLVPYNAQQRFYPGTSPHGPSVWRQVALIPKVVSNSLHLIIHGASPYHHSAYFVSLWQVGTVRSAGRLSLVLTIPVSIVALLVAGWLWQTLRSSPTRLDDARSPVSGQ
jgi:hypothetical protein